MTREDHKDCVDSAEQMTDTIETFLFDHGIVGLSIALKMTFKKMEKTGISKEFMTSMLINEMQKSRE